MLATRERSDGPPGGEDLFDCALGTRVGGLREACDMDALVGKLAVARPIDVRDLE